MKHILLLAFFCSALSSLKTSAQIDSLAQQDSVSAMQKRMKEDSAELARYSDASLYTPFYFPSVNKQTVFDVQQLAHKKNNAIVFFVLFLLLLILTYTKTMYSKDIEEMLQSLTNRNIAMQIFRTQTNEFTFSSLLLHLNFLLAISLYARFILVKYYGVTSLESFSSILFLIILFTFFYLAKIVAVKIIGNVFETNETSDEYVFNLSAVSKTLGLVLIPALFIFYTSPEYFFNFIFAITVVVVIAFVLWFVFRGLSTGYKFMYKSVYHFFIYVCVVEISPIFLLIKLLTKTVV